MSWLFSQALAEEYSEGICSDGEQSAPLSGTPTQQAFCSPDKMTEFSRLSRFGMTYRPLTADLGEAVLMSYLGAFPARTLAQPEKEQESPETGQACGFTWPGSWAKYDPNTSLWKTRQCSLLGDLEPFSETWPRWGTMQDGEFWELPTLALHTSETESGLWPTPQTRGFVNDGDLMSLAKMCDNYEEMSRMAYRAAEKKKQKYWPTPTTQANLQIKGEGAAAFHGKRGTTLAGAVSKWPTPCATDYKGSGQTGMLRDRLDYAVERGATKSNTYPQKWPTPRTQGMCGGTGSWELLKKNTTIEEARAMGAGNGGQLNPTWVEWLMGWPLAWTDLRPLETDRFQQWQQQHGEF